jgi:hypothetical protein
MPPVPPALPPLPLPGRPTEIALSFDPSAEPSRAPLSRSTARAALGWVRMLQPAVHPIVTRISAKNQRR